MKLARLAIVTTLALTSVNAGAATLINGGFDEDAPAAPFDTAPPQTVLGWQVTRGTVDKIGSYWVNQGGSAGSIDLAGNGPGTLAQTFTTVAGQAYRVSFFLAGNPAGGPTVKSLAVSGTGGSTKNYTFNTTGFSLGNMGWAEKFYTFRANSNSTTLSFAAGDDSSFYGPALDSVSIAAGVPEPATWAMMILGFGVVGGGLRRRRAAMRPSFA